MCTCYASGYMFLTFSILEVLSGVGLSLGVGASTFALVFFFQSMRSAGFKAAARPLQHVVYTVLRVAMVVVLLAEAGKAALYLMSGASLLELAAVDPLLLMWTLIGVLYANAILMTFHYMPMWAGPAIQATSWYALGVLVALPAVPFSYLSLLFSYLAAVVLVGVGIEMGRRIIQKETSPAD